MDIHLPESAPDALLGAVMLALLITVAVVSITVLLVGVIATTMVALGLAWIDACVRRMRRRKWLRAVHNSWRPTPPATQPSKPAHEYTPAKQGVAVLSAHDAGVRIHLLAVHVPNTSLDRGSMVLVRAMIDPAAQLKLPAQQDGYIVIYILGGRGTVGVQRKPVAVDQVAVLKPGTTIMVAAAAHDRAPLDVLILDHPRHHGRSVTINNVAAMRQRLARLQELTDCPAHERRQHTQTDNAGANLGARLSRHTQPRQNEAGQSPSSPGGWRSDPDDAGQLTRALG